MVNGFKEQQQLLQELLSNDVEVDMLVAAVQEKYDDSDLSHIKNLESFQILVGRKVQIRCRVKIPGNGCDETVFFQPRLGDEEEELTFSDSVCRTKYGRTSYAYLDVMNKTRKDRVLPQGVVIVSVHRIGAVIPMMKFAESGTGQEATKAEVGAVEGTVDTDNTSEKLKPKWNMSHLDEVQRQMMEEMLERNRVVFLKDESDIGDIPDFRMSIHLVENVPVKAAY